MRIVKLWGDSPTIVVSDELTYRLMDGMDLRTISMNYTFNKFYDELVEFEPESVPVKPKNKPYYRQNERW